MHAAGILTNSLASHTRQCNNPTMKGSYMKYLYAGFFCILLNATLWSATAGTEGQNLDQDLRKSAHQSCEKLSIMLDKLITYANGAHFKNKKEILYEFRLLEKCVNDDLLRVDNATLEELNIILLTAEFLTQNMSVNIPAHLPQICTGQPAASERPNLLTASDLLERYQKLQDKMDTVIETLSELNKTKIERLLQKIDATYSQNKSWLEPSIATAILVLTLGNTDDIKQFVSNNKLACSVTALFLFYLRAQKRSSIAALKDKLPAALYYPLALLKWCVGSHEKGIRVSIPYGTNINLDEIKTWVSAQEKRCGIPIWYDDDKIIAPFGFGSIARLIGMKNDVSAPFSFSFGPSGVDGNIFFYRNGK